MIRRRSYKPMTPKEFRVIVKALGLSQIEVAVLFNRGHRTVHRYAVEGRVPAGDAIVLRALARQEMTIEQVLDLAAAKPPH